MGNQDASRYFRRGFGMNVGDCRESDRWNPGVGVGVGVVLITDEKITFKERDQDHNALSRLSCACSTLPS